MEEKQIVKARIVNKSAEGVTLDLKSQGLQMYPWELFKIIYHIENKVWAIMNDQVVKKFDKINGYVDQCADIYLELEKLNKDSKEYEDLSDQFNELIGKINGVWKLDVNNIVTLIQISVNSRKKSQFKSEKKKKTQKTENKAINKGSKTNNISVATNKLGDFPGFDKLLNNYKK